MNICIEGIDGCGKSTQVEMLSTEFKLRKWKFPNKETTTGKLIYNHLDKHWFVSGHENSVDGGDLGRVDAYAFQAMNIVNRYESVEPLRRDMITSGVVIDRYWPSGFAYGAADGLDQKWLINVHNALPPVDVYLLLDIDLKESIERRPERRDRYEKNMQFMERVVQGYRRLWAYMQISDYRSSWVVINARGPKEDTFRQIDTAIKEFYREKTK